MKPWVKFEVIALAFCLAINGFIYWATVDYPQKAAIARQTPAPEGYRYLDACDGRPTDLLSKRRSDAQGGCLADYPGDFARSITLAWSVSLFFLAQLFLLLLASSKINNARRYSHGL